MTLTFLKSWPRYLPALAPYKEGIMVMNQASKSIPLAPQAGAREKRKFFLLVAIAPLLSYMLITLAAVGLGVSFMHGKPGVELMLLAGVPSGMLLGAVIAQFGGEYGRAAATFSGVVTVLLYWSIRWFVFDLDHWGQAAGFVLVAPCFFLGAYLIDKHQKRLASVAKLKH